MLPGLTSVTRTTFRVVDFLSWQRAGHLQLRPPFQRESVWTKKAKSYFIDTILRGYPVPLIFVQDQADPKTYEPQRQVVDGQQRIRTVLSYIDPDCLDDRVETDDFRILRAHRADDANASFLDLGEAERQRILDYEFSVHVLPSGTPSQVLLEIFARMNSTGVRLNDQENRNAEFHGAFKHFVHELSLAHLDDWLEWRILSRSQVARMRDRELTSELILLLHEGIAAKRQGAITSYYQKYDDDYPAVREASRRFERVMTTLREAYSPIVDNAYGDSFSQTPFNTQGWFYVLFGLVHSKIFSDTKLEEAAPRPKRLDPDDLREHLDRKADDLRGDALGGELTKALRGAATDRQSRLIRYDFLADGL